MKLNFHFKIQNDIEIKCPIEHLKKNNINLGGSKGNAKDARPLSVQFPSVSCSIENNWPK